MTLNTMKERVTLFVREVIAEAKKVSWSTKQEFVGSTIVIVFSIVIMSFFIGAVDFVLSRVFSLIM